MDTITYYVIKNESKSMGECTINDSVIHVYPGQRLKSKYVPRQLTENLSVYSYLEKITPDFTRNPVVTSTPKTPKATKSEEQGTAKTKTESKEKKE